MSAVDNLGAHLLGRRPSVPDDRDYKLADYLGKKPSPLAPLIAEVEKAMASFVAAFMKLVHALDPQPAPSPDPVPPSPVPPAPVAVTDVVYPDPDPVLDQGQTSECVGNGWAGWADIYPGVNAHYTEAEAHTIYEACTFIDGDPGAENGSTVRTGAQVMQNMGRLKTYAFAATIDEVRAWLDAHGPVVFGIEWSNSMFNVDAEGFVSPADAVADPSQIAGGHCILCVGNVPSKGALEFQNSWGASWGLSGRCYMTVTDAAVLLKGIQSAGEACAAVELAG